MKTKFFKLILPLLLVVVAVTSAFTTSASSAGSDAALVIGYLQTESTHTDCDEVEMCSTINTGAFCRVGQQDNNPRLWDFNSANKCEQVLYKP